MAGKPGRSGGHNKVSAQEHLLRGTFNVTRHGPRPATQATAAGLMTKPNPSDEAPLAGLVGPGRRFVEDCWRTYDGWTPATVVLLREVGMVIDALEQQRGQRGERAAQRVLLSLLAALNLKD